MYLVVRMTGALPIMYLRTGGWGRLHGKKQEFLNVYDAIAAAVEHDGVPVRRLRNHWMCTLDEEDF